MEMQNGTATLEDSLAFSYKTKHTHTVWSSNCIAWYLLNYIENLSTHTHINLHVGVYSNFIHNCQNLKATKHSGEWINKLWCIQTTECYSTLTEKRERKKRKGLPSHEKTWRNRKCVLLNERSQSEKATYYMIPTMWHPRKLQRQKYGVKRSLPRVRGGAQMKRQTTKFFKAEKV